MAKIHRNDKKVAVDFRLVWGYRWKIVKNNKIFKFAFGVKPNAKNRGGINVFGSKFGDYRQHIILTVSYKKAETTK